ncbi:Protein rds1 [Penicillium waksmanii]|uniref:Protein rds1 n=1 Tax=Penicillium waksmanii TaxID=69791 RepID=UPI00254750E4|nr:Protein rds1 [Penicillium waksmanii]KAJ5973470.1 Protein rds1 [Penicillium waksmanii]
MLGPLLLLSLVGSLPFTFASSHKNSHHTTTDLDSVSEALITGPSTRSHPSSQPHTPFSGTPSTTGALTATSVGQGISSEEVLPAATTYPSDGKLHNAEPAPYVPAGGVGTNGSIPVYNVKSDFDYESLALALYQEWIELDLFLDGLRRFSVEDFKSAGLTSTDRDLIAFMAQQEVGHATMLSNILGAQAPQQCTYHYPYRNVTEFLDLCQEITRFGEAGVYGFLAHLDSREAATLLTQSITTEARQQLIFRQFLGLFPMPEWFETGIPQSWAWSLLAPYISSCPFNQTRLVWQNFPELRIINQPTILNGSSNNWNSTVSAMSSRYWYRRNWKCRYAPESYPALSFPGRQVTLQWDSPGSEIGPNNSYITTSQATRPKYVVWVSQLNVTYTPLRVGHGSRGYTHQPNLETYQGDPAINGTMFIAITDHDPYLTPFNLSLINPHVIAGPAIYQAG